MTLNSGSTGGMGGKKGLVQDLAVVFLVVFLGVVCFQVPYLGT